MLKISMFGVLINALLIFACKNSSQKQNASNDTTIIKHTQADSLPAYKSETLIVQKLSDHIYLHTSFLKTNDFGKVDCNGMIIANQGEAIVFDTPANDSSSEELINYIRKELNCNIKAIIPTHFHEDCVGGLEKFNQYSIPSYASNMTIGLLNKKQRKFSKPIPGFDDSLTLMVGDKKVYAAYFGEGHTRDNIIGWFPDDNAVFGGCLIKEVNATKGNLADANVNSWSATVLRIKEKYPQAKIVVPGHGKWGDTELFDYTINLFK